MKIAKYFLMAAAVVFALAACNKTDDPNSNNPGNNENPGTNEEPEETAVIVIDGQFEDWDAAPNLAIAECPEDAAKASLLVMKVTSDADFIYVYFEQLLDDDQKEAPFNLMFNTDNDVTTGASSYLWDNPGWDCYIESEKGFISNGTAVQDMSDMVLYKFVGPAGADGWDDASYLEAQADITDFTVNAGVVKNGLAKVEVSVKREVLGLKGKKIQVGMIGYNAEWGDTGVLPQGEGGAVDSLLEVELD